MLQAIWIDNGRTVVIEGERKFVGSAHYSGPIDGMGTSVLCFTDGTEWSGPSNTELEVLSDPRSFVEHPCSGEHSTQISASKCDICGVDLCDLCGSDEHFVGEGHDLNNPRYWGV
jgi:hypothetical protein